MRVLIVSLGGTIGMSRSDDGGGVPSLDSNDFINSLNNEYKFNHNVVIEAKSFCNFPSGSLNFGILGDVITYCKCMVDNGINAIVITQGTDTIEETSFLFNLCWDRNICVVFSGAMRMSGELSYDGIYNIKSSINVAISPYSMGRGVLVVFGDRIFSSNWVKKIHSTFIDAFDAINIDGIIVENKPVFFYKPLDRLTYTFPKMNKRILFLEQNLGEDNTILDYACNFDGIVINGFGSGHVSCSSMNKIKNLNIPVVVSSRSCFGFTTSKTYGYCGSEIDLQNYGVIMSGLLDGRRSRILLWCILGNNLDVSEFRRFESSIVLG